MLKVKCALKARAVAPYSDCMASGSPQSLCRCQPQQITASFSPMHCRLFDPVRGPDVISKGGQILKTKRLEAKEEGAS